MGNDVLTADVRGARSVDRRSLGLWLAWGAGLGVATVIVHLYDPNVSGSYGFCPLRWTTGLLCPFCGATRAVHALTHGDLDGAWGLNPLIVAVIPMVIALWGYALWRAMRGQGTDYFARASTFWIVVAGLAVFAVLRNTAVLMPYLAPLT